MDSLGFIFLGFVYPNLDMVVQDQLKLRTYEITSLCIWFILLIFCTLLSYSLSAQTKLAICMLVLTRYRANLLFPLELLQIWRSKSIAHSIADPVERCFQRYFRVHHNLQKLVSRSPQILLANYPNDRFESFVAFMLPVPFVLVLKESSWYNRILKLDSRVECIKVANRNSYGKVKEEIRKKILENNHIFAYINNPSSIHPRHYERYRSGLVRIAYELGIPITPIVVDQFETASDGALLEQPFRIHVGESQWVTHVPHALQTLRHTFQAYTQRFRDFKHSAETDIVTS